MGRLERHASRLVRSVPRERREDLRLEILGHLHDLAAEGRRKGLSERAARRRACDELGDRHRLRTDLARAARGRRTVLFSEGLRGWLTSLWIYDRTSFAVVLLLVVVIRYGVLGTYHIPTKSMEPTLIGRDPGGDRILVDTLTYWTLRRIPGLRSLASEVRRWDILVFENDKAGENFIKRVGGMPGERLAVSNGDLFVNGGIATKPPDVREAMMIPLVVPRLGEPQRLLDEWTRSGGEWEVGRRRLEVRAGADGEAILSYPRPLRAWYIDHEGERRGGSMDVLDVRLSVDATWRDGAGGIRLVAGQGQAPVEFFVPGGEGRATLVYAGREVAARDDLRLETGRETRLRVSRIDGVLRGEVDGEVVLERMLDWSLARAEDYEASTCGAKIRVTGGSAALRAVRIDRDVHYTREGNLSGDGVVVPAGHYYMLGDNSSNSQDSRRYKAFPEEAIIGRPHVVFWPPSRWRLVR
jgi:signal peptidase I